MLTVVIRFNVIEIKYNLPIKFNLFNFFFIQIRYEYMVKTKHSIATPIIVIHIYMYVLVSY